VQSSQTSASRNKVTAIFTMHDEQSWQEAAPATGAGKKTFAMAGHDFPVKSWYSDPALRKLYICLMFVVLTSATNGYDGSMMNGLQTLSYWQEYFNHPTKATLGLLGSIMSVGSIAAIPFVPYAADIFGRRTGIVIGCVIMLLGVVLQSISINIKMFLAGRFFIGFGVAIAHGASPLLITELVHPCHRAAFTSMYNTTWYLGAIIAAWLTVGTLTIGSNWSWRVPSIVQALPSVLQLFFVWFVPESPRWLIAHGREEQAHKVLADCHANGDKNDALVVLELQEISETLKLEKEFSNGSWLDLVKTKGNRHRLFICVSAGLFSQWSGNGLVSYYINIVLDQIGYTNPMTQNVINGVLQIFSFAVALTMANLVDRIGRRPLFITATAGMLVSFIAWTICSSQYAQHGTVAAANGVVGFIYIFYFFYCLAWSGLLVGYTVEILPYNIRAKGMTCVWLTVDVALFFNQYVNPIALGNIAWKYYIFYCVWLGVELAVVYFFYPETKNTPLEEIAKIFDGNDSALVGGAAATEKGAALAHEIGLDDTHTAHAAAGLTRRGGSSASSSDVKKDAGVTVIEKI